MQHIKMFCFKKSIYLLFIALFTISVYLRIPTPDSENYTASDATYHVLLTMKAYEETPISIHKFLPIVSFGEEGDKNIAWGATIPDKYGNYYYTSFSPAGFVAPYLFVKTFGLPINQLSLYIFNSFIQLLCCILTIFLFLKVFKEQLNKDIIIIAVTLIYLFQNEIMHSQGIVYWHHSLFQLFFLIQLIVFLNMKKVNGYLLFFLLCLINPYIEWTGYISNAGFFFTLLLVSDLKITKVEIKISTKSFLSMIMIILCTISSFALFSLHFLTTVSKSDYILALKSRFFARNFTTNSAISDLLYGYFNSYGLLILAILITAIPTILFKKTRNKFLQLIRKDYLVWFLVAFPLFENILMKQHATQYTFDRLKGIFLLIIFILSFLVAWKDYINNKKVVYAAALTILMSISIYNFVKYTHFDNIYRWDIDYLEDNNILSEYLNSEFQESTSIVGQKNLSVRGYTNLEFHRGIYEGVDESIIINLAKANQKKYAILLLPEDEPWGLFKYSSFMVYDIETNESFKILLKNDDIQKIKQS